MILQQKNIIKQEKEIANAKLPYLRRMGIRTPAPVTRPNDLANRPLQPLE